MNIYLYFIQSCSLKYKSQWGEDSFAVRWFSFCLVSSSLQFSFFQLFYNVNFYKAWKFHIIYVCGVAGCCENVWECATSVTQSLAGGGGCRDMWGLAWQDPDQFPGSISFSSPAPLPWLPHPVMRGERGCDVTMSRVSPGPHCHIVTVTLLPHLPGPGVGWEVVAGAGYHQSRDRSQEPASECIGAWLGPTLLRRSWLVNTAHLHSPVTWD